MFPFVRPNQILVRLPAQLLPLSGGARTVKVEAGTVDEVFTVLRGRFPALVQAVLTENGSVRLHVNVFVNRGDIRMLDRGRTELHAGDVMTVLPSITGG